MRKLISCCPWIVACFFILPVAHAEQINLSTPYCTSPFKLNGAKCEKDQAALDKLDQTTCKGTGLKYDGSACKAEGDAPTPACHQVAGGTQTLKGESCQFSSQTGSSASGDYVGDYFTIVAVPADNPNLLGGQPGTKLRVLSQAPLGPDDKMLKLSPLKNPDAEFLSGRLELTGDVKEVKASDLIEYGANRTGWTYGALMVPYKYYAGGKNFGSGVSVGPYVGRRWGRPGSAITLALAAAIGNVKGEVRDADNKITSTPDLMAYSVAAGVMWDISKAQGVKPFKIGLFSGVDTVSSDDTVKFKNNRKPWLAFQIGFDFTDN